MNKTVVIYHKADFDGIFCREIAKKFLPGAELIGWDYGDPTPEIQEGAKLFMLDISVEALMDFPGLVWIDHHKSAIEKFNSNGRFSDSGHTAYLIDGVAACRLAWQFFANYYHDPTACALPDKPDYVDRKVDEPLAVRLAGEYDIWDKRDPDAELFQHGLRSRELTDITWKYLLGEDRLAGVHCVDDLLPGGKVVQYVQTKQNESIIKAAGFTIEFEGLKFLACNHARYNSHLFTAGLTPEHDACFGFCWRDGQWVVSLYHAPGKEQHDLSQIAVKYGGGGHRGACGFRVKTLSFLNENNQH